MEKTFSDFFDKDEQNGIYKGKVKKRKKKHKEINISTKIHEKPQKHNDNLIIDKNEEIKKLVVSKEKLNKETVNQNEMEKEIKKLVENNKSSSEVELENKNNFFF